MNMNQDEILNYWNREDVVSMYDKNLLNLETKLIKSYLRANSKILDAGCGEGESTMIYSGLPNTIIHAVDFSETRLCKAKQNLKGIKNVYLRKLDFLKSYEIDHDYDFIISQRFLINILDWKLQKKIIKDLIDHLKPTGKLILLEGSKNGVDELNNLRHIFKLPIIPVKWHNLFLDDHTFEAYVNSLNCKILNKNGLGEYFMLTRGIRPFFEKVTNWDADFNKFASDLNLKKIINCNDKFSRLKLWVIKKNKLSK